MDKRTIVRKVRLTPEEDALFMRKAARYKAVSAMIPVVIVVVLTGSGGEAEADRQDGHQRISEILFHKHIIING